MTGLICCATAFDMARSVSRLASAGANCTCSIPRTAISRRSDSSGSVRANPPLRGRKRHMLDPPHGYLAPFGLLGVDPGESAARRAVSGEPAAACRYLEGCLAHLPARAVEDHVRADSARDAEGLLGPA